MDAFDEGRAHVVAELGMAVRIAGDGLHGTAAIAPEMHVPGTSCLRTSILAVWTDMLCGLLAGQHMEPRVPVTLDLAVDLFAPPDGVARVEGHGRVVKAGRSVVVAAVDFVDDAGARFGIATASFMAAPDATLTLPPLSESLRAHRWGESRLTAPLAERVGCAVRTPGVAALPRSTDTLNAANTINGGLIGLAVEEAVRSAGHGVLSSLSLRYLRAARVGPAVATAVVHGDVAQAEVRDEGGGDRLAVTATTRAFRADPI